MRIRYTLAAIVGLGVLTACDRDVAGVDTILDESATIRYVNAVPDTGLLDFRFVDGSIEGSPQYAGIQFRTFTPYQRVRPGTRQMKVFTNPNAFGNSAAVAVQTHIDTTFTFEPNARYTIVSFGFSRPGATTRHRLVIYRDEQPTNLSATQVGVRAIHAAAGVGPVDVYVNTSETPAGIAGAPTLANVAERTASGYLPIAARATGASLTYRFDITAPGGTTALPLFNNVGSGLLGLVGTPTRNPLAGFQVGRTFLTAMVFPASVVGSRAPQVVTGSAPTLRWGTAEILFLPDGALDTTER